MKNNQLKNIFKYLFFALIIFWGHFLADVSARGLTDQQKNHVYAAFKYDAQTASWLINDLEKFQAEIEEEYSDPKMSPEQFESLLNKIRTYLETSSHKEIREEVIGYRDLGYGKIFYCKKHLKDFIGPDRCKSALDNRLEAAGYIKIADKEIQKAVFEKHGCKAFFRQWSVCEAPAAYNFKYFLKNIHKYLLAQDVIDICNNAQVIVADEPQLLELNGSTASVIGDLHGDFEAFTHYYENQLKYDLKQGKSVVFLGDYVDRGDDSLKTVVSLLYLKTLYPNQVFLLRGNHEELSQNIHGKFLQECIERFNGKGSYIRCANPWETLQKNTLNEVGEPNDTPGVRVFYKMQEVFDRLSLAAIANGDTFCVHGGITPELVQDVKVINDIPKPLEHTQLNASNIPTAMVWSDPLNMSGTFIPNSNRGVGFLYGNAAVEQFLGNNRLTLIARGHQFPDDGSGHEELFNNRLCTVFSARDYGGTPSDGAILKFDNNNNNNISFLTLPSKMPVENVFDDSWMPIAP